MLTLAARRKLMKRFAQQVFVVTMAIALLAMTSSGQAEDYVQDYVPLAVQKEVTAEAMLADVIVVRPFGIAATVLGTAVFVVSLPFTLPTRSVDKAAQKLVVDPAKFTFARPLGYMLLEPGASMRRDYSGP
jgi:hypothetical protein